MPCHLSSDMHPIHQVEPCKFAETAWHLIECHAMDAMDAWGHGGHACGRAPWIRGVGWGSDGGDRRSCYACEYRPEESGGGRGRRRGRGATAQNESESEGRNSAGPSGKLMPALCDVVPFRIADPQAVSVRCLEHCGGCCDGLNSMQLVLSLL